MATPTAANASNHLLFVAVAAFVSGVLYTRDAGKCRRRGDSPSPSHDEVAAQPLASSGGGNELEFDMSAIDLSDMKVHGAAGKAGGKI